MDRRWCGKRLLSGRNIVRISWYKGSAPLWRHGEKFNTDFNVIKLNKGHDLWYDRKEQCWVSAYRQLDNEYGDIIEAAGELLGVRQATVAKVVLSQGDICKHYVLVDSSF